MNRWEPFLSSFLQIYLDNSLVTYVLVCDETGSDIESIQASQWRDHPKLILRPNNRRVGIYHNKRGCVQQSPTEWVALLDSDNLFRHDFFDSLADIWRSEGADPMHLYAAGHVFHHDLEAETQTAIIHGDVLVRRQNWNDVVYSGRNWNFMCNGGNWVLHRSAANVLPAAIMDKDVLATDAIFMLRIMVFHGYMLDVRSGLRYTHFGHGQSSFLSELERNVEIWVSTDYDIADYKSCLSILETRYICIF